MSYGLFGYLMSLKLSIHSLSKNYLVLVTEKKTIDKNVNKIKINPGKISFGDYSISTEYRYPGHFWFYPFFTPKCTPDLRKILG